MENKSAIQHRRDIIDLFTWFGHVSGHYSTRLGIVFMTCQHHCHVRVTCGPHAAAQMLNPNEAPARTGNPAQTTENLVRAPASSTCNEHLYYTCFFRVPEKILRRRRCHPEEAGASSGCPINLEKKVSSAQGLRQDIPTVDMTDPPRTGQAT